MGGGGQAATGWGVGVLNISPQPVSMTIKVNPAAGPFPLLETRDEWCFKSRPFEKSGLTSLHFPSSTKVPDTRTPPTFKQAHTVARLPTSTAQSAKNLEHVPVSELTTSKEFPSQSNSRGQKESGIWGGGGG